MNLQLNTNNRYPEIYSKVWFPYIKPINKPRIRLFCFPHAGGTASIYYSWFGSIDESIEVLPIQMPGRETRISEKPCTDISILCREIVEAIMPLLDGPYAFLGHSMGAFIAFETARLLRKRSVNLPSYLFLSAQRAPDLPQKSPIMYKMEEKELIKNLKMLGGIGDELLSDTQFIDLFLPVIRADMMICDTYKYSYEEEFNIPICVFGGSEDPDVSSSELIDWNKQTSKYFSARIFEGDHFYIKKYQNEIISDIRAILSKDGL